MNAIVWLVAFLSVMTVFLVTEQRFTHAHVTGGVQGGAYRGQDHYVFVVYRRDGKRHDEMSWASQKNCQHAAQQPNVHCWRVATDGTISNAIAGLRGETTTALDTLKDNMDSRLSQHNDDWNTKIDRLMNTFADDVRKTIGQEIRSTIEAIETDKQIVINFYLRGDRE